MFEFSSWSWWRLFALVEFQLQDLIYQDILAKIDEDITLDEVNNIIHYLFKRELIQKREAALLLQTLSTVFDKLDAKERVSFIKSLIMTLANFS